jgi:hypothetical protein
MFLLVQGSVGSPPQPGFLPKRGFHLSLRRAFQVGAARPSLVTDSPIARRGACGSATIALSP